MSDAEQTRILAVLHEPAYVDESLRTVFALLLDAGRYLASVSTFYRLLRGVRETRSRRNQLLTGRLIWRQQSFSTPGDIGNLVLALSPDQPTGE